MEESKFDKRRRELFNQISVLIEKEDFSNLTVRYMCKELGISIGTFYHYFPEKGDIAQILFSGIDDYFEHDVSEKFQEDEIQNLILFAESYGQFATDTGVEAAKSISVAPLQYSADAYLNEERSIFQVLLGIIERGVEKNQFKLNQTELEVSRMIMLLLRGYSSDWAKNNGNYDLVAQISKFMNLFTKALI